jgi:hypothetical protein
MSPPSAGLKTRPSKKPTRSRQQVELCGETERMNSEESFINGTYVQQSKLKYQKRRGKRSKDVFSKTSTMTFILYTDK